MKRRHPVCQVRDGGALGELTGVCRVCGPFQRTLASGQTKYKGLEFEKNGIRLPLQCCLWLGENN